MKNPFKKTSKTPPTRTIALRTIPNLQEEYNQLALRAGEIYFRIDKMGKEVTKIHERMEALDREATIIRAEDAAKQAREAEKNPTPEAQEPESRQAPLNA